LIEVGKQLHGLIARIDESHEVSELFKHLLICKRQFSVVGTTSHHARDSDSTGFRFISPNTFGTLPQSRFDHTSLGFDAHGECSHRNWEPEHSATKHGLTQFG
jgi:hypothetical protein